MKRPHGAWKSADEIEEDIAAGEDVQLQRLILDLWLRVDELQEALEAANRRIEELETR